MNILITGGAGFIGTHLRQRLLEDGHSVRIFDNLLEQVHGEDPQVEFADCEFIRGDVRNLASVTQAVKDIDVVYHLAAETGVGQSQYEIERYISTNTHGTAVVMQAAALSDVRQVIMTSSRAVYGEGVHTCTSCSNRFVPASRRAEELQAGNWEISCPVCGDLAQAELMAETDPLKPISIYGLTKVQQEQIAGHVGQTYQVPVTILRPYNVFGPGQSLRNPYVGVLGTFFRQLTSGLEIDIYEDGKMRRDFVYVGDVVKVLQASAGNPRAYDKTFNVGSGESVTLEEAGRAMAEALGVEGRMRISGKYRVGDIHHAVANTGLMQDILGFSSETSFNVGLKEFIDWAARENLDIRNVDKAAEQQLKDRNLLGQVRT